MKAKKTNYFSTLFWYRTLHVSDRFTVHHQESSTVYTAIRICHTGRVLYQNKFEKQCTSLACIIETYHDARSSECQTRFILQQ